MMDIGNPAYFERINPGCKNSEPTRGMVQALRFSGPRPPGALVDISYEEIKAIRKFLSIIKGVPDETTAYRRAVIGLTGLLESILKDRPEDTFRKC